MNLIDFHVTDEDHRSEADMKWQPIETAPKDGTSFDVWVKCVDCEFRGENFCFQGGALVNIFSDLPVNRHYGNVDPVATHWMPLPSPPTDNVAH